MLFPVGLALKMALRAVNKIISQYIALTIKNQSAASTRKHHSAFEVVVAGTAVSVEQGVTRLFLSPA